MVLWPGIPFRLATRSPPPVQRFCKEVIAWKALDHPNVVPLLGIPKDRSQLKFAMVSEWMINGNINQFVKAHRDVDRFKLVSPPHDTLPQSEAVTGILTISIARGRREGFGLYARFGDGPWGSEGGTSLEAAVITPL